jgi:hypothetical protein
VRARVLLQAPLTLQLDTQPVVQLLELAAGGVADASPRADCLRIAALRASPGQAPAARGALSDECRGTVAGKREGKLRTCSRVTASRARVLNSASSSKRTLAARYST